SGSAIMRAHRPCQITGGSSMYRCAAKFVGLCACALAAAATLAQDGAGSALRNPSLTPAARAADVVGHMTLEDKAAQLAHAARAIHRLGVPEYNWWNEGLHGVARAGVATVFPQAIGMAASWDQALMHEAAAIISTEFRAKYAATRRADGGSEWYRGLT